MTIIKIMNQYGVTIAIAGVLACALCGLLKVPIAKTIREKSLADGLDNKLVGDRVRNVCNAIVVAISATFISAWYIATEGIQAMTQAKVYGDILATFTVAKLIYMLYEGAGEMSIKKILHTLLSKILSRNNKIEQTGDETLSLIEIVRDYLCNTVALPLTDSQATELQNLLKSKNNNE